MADEQERLQALKRRMTTEQRKQMSELLANELQRREKAKKAQAQQARLKSSSVQNSRLGGALTHEDVSGIYSQINKLRGEHGASAEDNPSISERPQPLFSFSSRSALISTPKAAFILLIISFAIFKILLDSGVVSASPEKQAQQKAPQAAAGSNTIVESQTKGTLESAATTAISPIYSSTEKVLLTELDNRRVELEKRNESLNQRDRDLDNRERELASRLVELRTLTRRLTEIRQEKDHRYEARLEQLANVYGSMAPNEAAPLIAQLDEDIALSLLERMPGKRMGQILSSMDHNRAISLTKTLTSKKALN